MDAGYELQLAALDLNLPGRGTEDRRDRRQSADDVGLGYLERRRGREQLHTLTELASVELDAALDLPARARLELCTGHRVGAQHRLERGAEGDIGRKPAVQHVVEACAIRKLALVGVGDRRGKIVDDLHSVIPATQEE